MRARTAHDAQSMLQGLQAWIIRRHVMQKWILQPSRMTLPQLESQPRAHRKFGIQQNLALHDPHFVLTCPDSCSTCPARMGESREIWLSGACMSAKMFPHCFTSSKLCRSTACRGALQVLPIASPSHVSKHGKRFRPLLTTLSV